MAVKNFKTIEEFQKWAAGKMVGFDSETTGTATFGNKKDEPLQLAFTAVDPKTGDSGRCEVLIKPTNKTEWKDAELIHGITPADVESAPEIANLIPAIQKLVDNASGLMAYHSKFDMDILANAGIDFTNNKAIARKTKTGYKAKVVDPQNIFSHLEDIIAETSKKINANTELTKKKPSYRVDDPRMSRFAHRKQVVWLQRMLDKTEYDLDKAHDAVEDVEAMFKLHGKVANPSKMDDKIVEKLVKATYADAKAQDDIIKQIEAKAKKEKISIQKAEKEFYKEKNDEYKINLQKYKKDLADYKIQMEAIKKALKKNPNANIVQLQAPIKPKPFTEAHALKYDADIENKYNTDIQFQKEVQTLIGEFKKIISDPKNPLSFDSLLTEHKVVKQWTASKKSQSYAGIEQAAESSFGNKFQEQIEKYAELLGKSTYVSPQRKQNNPQYKKNVQDKSYVKALNTIKEILETNYSNLSVEFDSHGHMRVIDHDTTSTNKEDREKVFALPDASRVGTTTTFQKVNAKYWNQKNGQNLRTVRNGLVGGEDYYGEYWNLPLSVAQLWEFVARLQQNLHVKYTDEERAQGVEKDYIINSGLSGFENLVKQSIKRGATQAYMGHTAQEEQSKFLNMSSGSELNEMLKSTTVDLNGIFDKIIYKYNKNTNNNAVTQLTEVMHIVSQFLEDPNMDWSLLERPENTEEDAQDGSYKRFREALKTNANVKKMKDMLMQNQQTSLYEFTKDEWNEIIDKFIVYKMQTGIYFDPTHTPETSFQHGYGQLHTASQFLPFNDIMANRNQFGTKALIKDASKIFRSGVQSTKAARDFGALFGFTPNASVKDSEYLPEDALVGGLSISNDILTTALDYLKNDKKLDPSKLYEYALDESNTLISHALAKNFKTAVRPTSFILTPEEKAQYENEITQELQKQPNYKKLSKADMAKEVFRRYLDEQLGGRLAALNKAVDIQEGLDRFGNKTYEYSGLESFRSNKMIDLAQLRANANVFDNDLLEGIIYAWHQKDSSLFSNIFRKDKKGNDVIDRGELDKTVQEWANKYHYIKLLEDRGGFRFGSGMFTNKFDKVLTSIQDNMGANGTYSTWLANIKKEFQNPSNKILQEINTNPALKDEFETLFDTQNPNKFTDINEKGELTYLADSRNIFNSEAFKKNGATPLDMLLLLDKLNQYLTGDKAWYKVITNKDGVRELYNNSEVQKEMRSVGVSNIFDYGKLSKRGGTSLAGLRYALNRQIGLSLNNIGLKDSKVGDVRDKQNNEKINSYVRKGIQSLLFTESQEHRFDRAVKEENDILRLMRDENLLANKNLNTPGHLSNLSYDSKLGMWVDNRGEYKNTKYITVGMGAGYDIDASKLNLRPNYTGNHELVADDEEKTQEILEKAIKAKFPHLVNKDNEFDSSNNIRLLLSLPGGQNTTYNLTSQTEWGENYGIGNANWAIVGGNYFNKALKKRGGIGTENSLSNLVSAMYSTNPNITEEEKIKRILGSTSHQGLLVKYLLDTQKIKQNDSNVYKTTIGDYTPYSMMPDIHAMTNKSYSYLNGTGNTELQKFYEDFTTFGVAISQEEYAEMLRSLEGENLTDIWNLVHTQKDDQIKGVSDDEKEREKVIQDLLPYFTVGTKEFNKTAKAGLYNGKNRDSLIKWIVARAPYIKRLDARASNLVFADKTLNAKEAIFAQPLAEILKGDFDGDRYQLLRAIANDSIISKLWNSNKELTSADIKQVKDRMNYVYNSMAKRTAFAAQQIKNVNTAKLAIEKKNNKGTPVEKPIFSDSKDTESITDYYARAIIGNVVHASKGAVGPLSNLATNIRGLLDEGGYSEWNPKNPNAKLDLKNITNTAIMGSFYESLEQDSISAKKALNHIQKKYGLDSISATFRVQDLLGKIYGLWTDDKGRNKFTNAEMLDTLRELGIVEGEWKNNKWVDDDTSVFIKGLPAQQVYHEILGVLNENFEVDEYLEKDARAAIQKQGITAENLNKTLQSTDKQLHKTITSIVKRNEMSKEIFQKTYDELTIDHPEWQDIITLGQFKDASKVLKFMDIDADFNLTGRNAKKDNKKRNPKSKEAQSRYKIRESVMKAIYGNNYKDFKIPEYDIDGKRIINQTNDQNNNLSPQVAMAKAVAQTVAHNNVQQQQQQQQQQNSLAAAIVKQNKLFAKLSKVWTGGSKTATNWLTPMHNTTAVNNVTHAQSIDEGGQLGRSINEYQAELDAANQLLNNALAANKSKPGTYSQNAILGLEAARDAAGELFGDNIPLATKANLLGYGIDIKRFKQDSNLARSTRYGTYFHKMNESFSNIQKAFSTNNKKFSKIFGFNEQGWFTPDQTFLSAITSNIQGKINEYNQDNTKNSDLINKLLNTKWLTNIGITSSGGNIVDFYRDQKGNIAEFAPFTNTLDATGWLSLLKSINLNDKDFNLATSSKNGLNSQILQDAIKKLEDSVGNSSEYAKEKIAYENLVKATTDNTELGKKQREYLLKMPDLKMKSGGINGLHEYYKKFFQSQTMNGQVEFLSPELQFARPLLTGDEKFGRDIATTIDQGIWVHGANTNKNPSTNKFGWKMGSGLGTFDLWDFKTNAESKIGAANPSHNSQFGVQKEIIAPFLANAYERFEKAGLFSNTSKKTPAQALKQLVSITNDIFQKNLDNYTVAGTLGDDTHTSGDISKMLFGNENLSDEEKAKKFFEFVTDTTRRIGKNVVSNIGTHEIRQGLFGGINYYDTKPIPQTIVDKIIKQEALNEADIGMVTGSIDKYRKMEDPELRQMRWDAEFYTPEEKAISENYTNALRTEYKVTDELAQLQRQLSAEKFKNAQNETKKTQEEIVRLEEEIQEKLKTLKDIKEQTASAEASADLIDPKEKQKAKKKAAMSKKQADEETRSSLASRYLQANDQKYSGMLDIDHINKILRSGQLSPAKRDYYEYLKLRKEEELQTTIENNANIARNKFYNDESMFEHDKKGNRIQDPNTGKDVLSSAGKEWQDRVSKKEKQQLKEYQLKKAIEEEEENEFKKQKTLIGGLAGAWKRYKDHFTSIGIMYSIVARLRKALQQLIPSAKELDQCLTNIRIVTGQSRDDAKNLMISYSGLAKQLGVTTTAVAAAANDWLRQGYSIRETNNLITSSIQLAKLGMIDAGQATKFLTSILHGFKLEAVQATDVVDKLTSLDMKAATSAGDIATALQQFSVSGQMAGLDLDQAAAMATTIMDVSQRDAGSVGTALKTMIARFGNVKAGKFASDGTEDTENLNDVETVLKKIGISMRNSNNEFRDFDDVLEDIAAKWKTLDNVSQNAISSAMAGTRQREQFNVLMENMDKYHEFLEISRNSEGTAAKKYQAYLDSVEASQAKIKAQWEKMAQNADIANLLKLINNTVSGLMEALPYIIKYGAILLTMIVAAKSKKIGGSVLGYLFGKDEKGRPNVGLGSVGKYIKTIGKGANKKASLKLFGTASSKIGVGMGVFGGVMSGLTANTTHRDQNGGFWGNKRESSKEAAVVQKITTGGLSGIAGIIGGIAGGPVGAMIGSAVGNAVGSGISKIVAHRMDRDRDQRLIRVETAEKNLDAINKIQNTTSILAEYSHKTLLNAEEAKEFQNKILKITESLAKADTKVLGNVWNNITNGSDALTIGDKKVSNLYDLIDLYENGDSKTREIIASKMQAGLAKQEAEELLKSKENDIYDAKQKIQEATSVKGTYDFWKGGALSFYNYGDLKGRKGYFGRWFENDTTKAFREWAEKNGVAYTNTGTWGESLTIDQEKYSLEELIKLKEDFLNNSSLDKNTDAWQEQNLQLLELKSTWTELLSIYKQVNSARAQSAIYNAQFSDTYGKTEYQGKSLVDLTETQLKGLSEKEIKDLIVSQIEAEGGFEGYSVHSEKGQNILNSAIKNNSTIYNVISGQAYTLSEALSKKNIEALKQFSQALNVPISELHKLEETLGSLKLSDLLKGMTAIREEANKMGSVLASLATSTGLVGENFEMILKSYPELIPDINNTEKLTSSLMRKIKAYNAAYATSIWGQLSGDQTYFKETFATKLSKSAYNSIFFNDKLKQATSINDLLPLISAGDKVAKEKYGIEKKDYEEIVTLYEQLYSLKVKDEVTTNFLNTQIQYMTKMYQKQLDNLSEQKQALEDINKKREYENKLIEAKLKLENAQKEKKRVFRAGIGWVYESDQTAIKEAQAEVDTLVHQKTAEDIGLQMVELQASITRLNSIAENAELANMSEVFKGFTNEMKLNSTNLEEVSQAINNLYGRTGILINAMTEAKNFGKTEAETHKNIFGNGTDSDSLLSRLKAAEAKANEIQKNPNKGVTSEDYKEAWGNYQDLLLKYQEQVTSYRNKYGKEAQDLTAEQKEYFDKNAKNRIADVGIDMAVDGRQMVSNKNKMSEHDVNSFREGGWGPWHRDTQWTQNGSVWTPVPGNKFDDFVRNAPHGTIMRHDGRYAVKLNDGLNGSGWYTLSDKTYADGTLSAQPGASLINEKGTEAIVTPNGTITALPSASGVVPADITKNLWELGEIAPSLLRMMTGAAPKNDHISKITYGNDESLNIQNVNMTVNADESFDVDAFTTQLKTAMLLNRNNRR